MSFVNKPGRKTQATQKSSRHPNTNEIQKNKIAISNSTVSVQQITDQVEVICRNPNNRNEYNCLLKLMHVFSRTEILLVKTVDEGWEWFTGAYIHKGDYEKRAMFIISCICLATVSIASEEQRNYNLDKIDEMITKQPFCIVKIIQKIESLKQNLRSSIAQHLESENVVLIIEKCVLNARKVILSKLKEYNSEKNTGKLFAIYKFLVKLETALGDSRMSELYSEKLKEIAVPSQVLDGYYQTLLVAGVRYLNEACNTKKALTYFRKADELLQNNPTITRNDEREMELRCCMGEIYIFEKEFNNEKEGVACLEKAGVKGLISLGMFFYSIKKDYKQAAQYFYQALKAAASEDDQKLRREIHSLLGKAYYKLGHYSKAIPMLEAAIKFDGNQMTHILNSKDSSQSEIFIFLAQSYSNTGSFSKARDVLHKYSENKQVGVKSKISNKIAERIGLTYIQESNFSEAVKVLVPNIGKQPEQATFIVFSQLCVAYCGLNDFKEASIYLKKFDIIKNQIVKKDRATIYLKEDIENLYQVIKGLLLSSILATHFAARAKNDPVATKSLRELSTTKITRTEIKNPDNDSLPSPDNQLDVEGALLSADTKRLTHNLEVEIIDTAMTDVVENYSGDGSIKRNEDFNILQEDKQDTDLDNNTQRFDSLYIGEEKLSIRQIEKIITQHIPKNLKCLSNIGKIYSVVGLPNCYILIPFALINNSIIDLGQKELFQTARSTADQGIKQIRDKKHTVVVNNKVEKSPVSEVKIGGDDYRIILFREGNVFIPRFAGPKSKKSGSNPRDMVNREWTYPDSDLVRVINYLRSGNVEYLEPILDITPNQ